MMGRSPCVRFASSPQTARQADDEEYDVMSRFANHASNCVKCIDPVKSGTLCDPGADHVREVTSYIYFESGQAYSVIDRQKGNEKIFIEIPVGCAVIKKLCQAVEQGLKLKRKKVIIEHSRARQVRRVSLNSREDYKTITTRPNSSHQSQKRHDGHEKYEQAEGVYVMKTRQIGGSKKDKRSSSKLHHSEVTIGDFVVPGLISIAVWIVW